MTPTELTVEIVSRVADAVDGFDRVGDSASGMADKVDRASRAADDAGDRMSRAADKADGLASSSSQASGGIGDIGGALALLPGPLGAVGTGMEVAGTAITGVTGAADLLNLAMSSTAIQTAKAAIATARQTVATRAQAVATKTATVAQRALNIVMRANPIGVVITVLAALVAVVVLAYKRSETFRKIVDRAFGVVKKVVVAAGKAFGQFKDAVIKRGGDALRWVVGLPGRIVRALSSLGRLLRTVAVGAFTRFRDGAVQVATRLVSFVTGLPGRISRGIGSLRDLLYDKGVAVVEGLYRGIVSMKDYITDRILSFVKAVLPGPVERALGIASPSKVMARLGRFAGEGLAVGILDRTDQVAAAARRLATAAQPELDLAGRTREQVEAAARVLRGASLPGLTIGMGGGTAGGGGAAAGGATVTINLTGLVGDKVSLGTYLERTLTEHFRRQGIRVNWAGR